MCRLHRNSSNQSILTIDIDFPATLINSWENVPQTALQRLEDKIRSTLSSQTSAYFQQGSRFSTCTQIKFRLREMPYQAITITAVTSKQDVQYQMNELLLIFKKNWDFRQIPILKLGRRGPNSSINPYFTTSDFRVMEYPLTEVLFDRQSGMLVFSSIKNQSIRN